MVVTPQTRHVDKWLHQCPVAIHDAIYVDPAYIGCKARVRNFSKPVHCPHDAVVASRIQRSSAGNVIVATPANDRGWIATCATAIVEIFYNFTSVRRNRAPIREL
jgi:hypothetical protein